MANMQSSITVAGALVAASLAYASPARAQTDMSTATDLSRQVEIRRTKYGVPHIRAENLKAAYFALAYVQLEDYGPRVALGLLRGRGEIGRFFGRDSADSDFLARRQYARAVETYPLLEQETRDVYEGFAAGVNRYVQLHPDQFPAEMKTTFTAYDVAARDVGGSGFGAAQRFLERIDTTRRRPTIRPDPGEAAYPEDGSNAWAFAPSRTKSKKAILLRNPHLQWTAGYYEAHITVPGILDYYGDFRIGGPFSVIGGFNRDLGWSTTNNDTDLDEIYALEVTPGQTDRYELDGTSIPLGREVATIEYKNGEGYSSETRELWTTSLGPVIHRAGGKIYVLRSAGDGDYRAGEQFLKMMRAKTLNEWKDAMRIRARLNSSFTYADRAGNIYYLWNASIPALPHASGGDTAAIPVTRTSQVWTRYVSYDSLPQLLNPKGGYIHNENDSPYYTNMRQLLDTARYPANFPRATLRLRSQHAIELLDNNNKYSLEDVIRLKHSYRMILADRVKPDLIAAWSTANPTPEIAAALDVLKKWDNTVAHASKGGVLFEAWWQAYSRGARGDSALYAFPWTPSDPMKTPRGLANSTRAREALVSAVAEVTRRYGSVDVAWGDVHRVRRGDVDVPVGGCSGALGCFRVLSFRPDSATGKRVAASGDGWVLAVEFGDIPRAYSILAYGQSPNPASPYHADQAAMFARGEMKPVAWTEKDIEAQTVKRYRPGLENQ